MSYRKPTCPACGKKTFDECGRLVCGMRKPITAQPGGGCVPARGSNGVAYMKAMPQKGKQS